MALFVLPNRYFQARSVQLDRGRRSNRADVVEVLDVVEAVKEKVCLDLAKGKQRYLYLSRQVMSHTSVLMHIIRLCN